MRRLTACLLTAVAIGMSASPALAQSSDFAVVGVTTLFAADGTLVDGGASQLDAIAAQGIHLARVDAAWPAVQPFATGGPRWNATDRIAFVLAQRGIRWLPVLGFATSWSTTVPGTDKAPPVDDDRFAAYAAQVGARYGPGGTFWTAHPELEPLPVQAVEVWNEPNIPAYWRPAPDPSRYARLYVAARDAVRAAAPGIQVLVGGLSPYGDPDGFLRAMASAQPGLAAKLDGVAIHPYARGPSQVITLVAATRGTLRDIGAPNVPISVTEVGWPRPNQSPTAAFSLPDDTRAGAVALLADALAGSDCGVDRLVLFTWATPMRDPLEQEDWFGLVALNGTPTPATTAFEAAAARTAAPVGLSVCGGAPTGRSLSLQLTLGRVEKGCAVAHVAYRGAPVNAIDVRFAQPSSGATASRATDDDGDAAQCFRRPGRVRAWAHADTWASSNLIDRALATVRVGGRLLNP